MPKYTVEVNDASGKKLSYDFDAPEGVDVGKYTQTPEFQAGVADAYRAGKLRPVEVRETAATNNPAPASTGPTTDTFLGGLKRGVQEGIAGVANIGTNIVRMVGDIDDKAESFLGVRPVAGSVGMLFANANPRMTEAALDPVKTAKETREVQAVANSYASKQLQEAMEMPEPKGFLANTGQVLGNVAVQAPAAIGAGAALGPVGGMAALGAAGNYKGDLGSAVYGGTVGAATGKLNVIAAPMKIGGRVLTGALTNAGQEVLLNDNPTSEGIAKTAAVGALFGAATPKFVPKDTKPKPVSTFRDVPAPDGPVVVPDRAVEKLQVKLTGLQKKADKIALVEKERELTKLKNKLTAMQKQELADARAKLAEIQQRELAEAKAQLAKLEAGELEPLPVPDAVPEVTASSVNEATETAVLPLTHTTERKTAALHTKVKPNKLFTDAKTPQKLFNEPVTEPSETVKLSETVKPTESTASTEVVLDEQMYPQVKSIVEDMLKKAGIPYRYKSQTPNEEKPITLPSKRMEGSADSSTFSDDKHTGESTFSQDNVPPQDSVPPEINWEQSVAYWKQRYGIKGEPPPTSKPADSIRFWGEVSSKMREQAKRAKETFEANPTEENRAIFLDEVEKSKEAWEQMTRASTGESSATKDLRDGIDRTVTKEIKPMSEEEIAAQSSKQGIETLDYNTPPYVPRKEITAPRRIANSDDVPEVEGKPPIGTPTYHGFLGSGAVHYYGSQVAAKAAQVLGVAKQEVKTGLQNMRVRANQAARNWNMVKLRTALADQSAPLAESEVEMGLRREYDNQYPDFTTGGKATHNENSSYEARRLFDNVVRGKVHNQIQEFDDALKTVFDIDPDLNGLRDHMLATRLKELQVRSAQSGQPNYNLPGANPRTGDAGWDSARISSALKDPRAGAFEQVARKARGILEAMVDEEVQLGILTPQRAAKMRADNQFYSPLFREEHYPVGKSAGKSTKGKKFSTDEAETFDAIDLRGSTEPVKDPISAFAAKIQSRRMAIERYKVVAQYLDQVDQYGQNGALGVGRRLPMNSQRDPNNPMHHVQKGEDIAVKFESGEPVEYAVPEDIGQALSMGNLAELGFFGKAMNKLGKMQTHFVTLPPTYIARNPLRDYRSAVSTSPIDYSIANSISGLTAALDDMFHPNSRVKAAREVGAVGGSQNVESHGYRETGTYEAPRPSLFTEPGRRLAKQELTTRPVATLYGVGKKAVKGVLVDWWNTPLTKLSQASETTTRMGLFERSGKEVDPALGRPYNPQERAFLTQNTLTDFSMRGTNETADLAFRTIPFLRARMLGMMTNADQTASLYATNPGQFLKTVAYMAIPAITIHAWNNSKFPEMAKKIDPEAYENADILILNDKVDSEGYATGVVVIPKEGLTRSISNAITHTMNAYRDDDYDNYLRTAVKFVAESIAPVDALNAQGEVDLGRTATSMLPPSIAAVIGATQNKDIRTGKKLFAGDTDAFSRGLYVSDTKTGKRDTSMLARTLSGAANWAAGDMQGSDPFGMLMSPVGIEQVGRNVFGQVGVAGAKVLDPVFGSLNTKLFKGTDDYPHTYGESGKAALRMLDPKNSLGRAFLRTDTTEEDKHVKLAAGTQGTVTNSINRAAESLTNNDQFLNAGSTPEQKMSVITQTLAKHGLVSETSPLSPEVLGDVLSVVERKMSATSMEFDSVDYTLQRLNNRGKAFFLYSLLQDPKYKPGGPKNDRLQIRVKKMTENKMITDGVLDELTFLLEKQEQEKARPAQETQPRKLFQTPVPAPPSPLFRQPRRIEQPGELN